MDRNRKRGSRDDYSKSSRAEQNKKVHVSSTLNQVSQGQQLKQHQSKRPTFVSYLETPNLPPKTKLLCEIIANTPSVQVERVFEDTGIRVTTEDVEEVLKLSYGFPAPAVKFFRWSGWQLNDKHSPYAWNLVVDLLGKNFMFDAMWDAIKSMKKENLLSLATFASVFSSYVLADRVDEAIMTFEVMDQYGCARDVVALNSLLSAICRDGKTRKALEFLHIAKNKIRPDCDAYAILLEGFENEGNVVCARQTFEEMLVEVGWDPRNIPAYDSFLNTLLRGVGIHEALKFFDLMKENRCIPGMKFFRAALDECVKTSNARGAGIIWEIMKGTNGCRPDTQMYNSMIALHCYLDHPDIAKRLLDEMVFNGAFPDSQTYNVLLQFLIKARKLREASSLFAEMVKNECFPNEANYTAALKIYLDGGEPDMAIKIWKCMVENQKSGLEDIANIFVVRLRDLDRLQEACKYAEDMIDRGIKLNSSTLSKLKHSLIKVGKGYMYDEILRKWKSR